MRSGSERVRARSVSPHSRRAHQLHHRAHHQIRYQKDCPNSRRSLMKFMTNSNGSVWETVNNYLPWQSSLPSSSSASNFHYSHSKKASAGSDAEVKKRKKRRRRKRRKSRVALERDREAKDLAKIEQTLITLDNVGTRASCPVQLLGSPMPDYTNVKSNMWWTQQGIN